MLQTAITMQTINYAFPFNTYSFPIDSNFVVVTRGRKSALLKTDVVVALKSTLADEDLSKILYKAQEEIVLPSQTKLDAFRDYILEARRTRVTLAEDVGKVPSRATRFKCLLISTQHIEDEFVRLRRESPTAPSSEDLARRMALAKLLSASFLENGMTKETWTAAGTMINR
jgi:Mini-chromosome maintenance replisome factor